MAAKLLLLIALFILVFFNEVKVHSTAQYRSVWSARASALIYGSITQSVSNRVNLVNPQRAWRYGWLQSHSIRSCIFMCCVPQCDWCREISKWGQTGCARFPTRGAKGLGTSTEWERPTDVTAIMIFIMLLKPLGLYVLYTFWHACDHAAYYKCALFRNITTYLNILHKTAMFWSSSE